MNENYTAGIEDEHIAQYLCSINAIQPISRFN